MDTGPNKAAIVSSEARRRRQDDVPGVRENASVRYLTSARPSSRSFKVGLLLSPSAGRPSTVAYATSVDLPILSSGIRRGTIAGMSRVAAGRHREHVTDARSSARRGLGR